MKKVLIITYYWPPSGGAGVHRWLKISKYLAEQNECYVYTPSNPDFLLRDESLMNKVSPEIKVLKRKIVEPYFIYRAFLNKSEKGNINQPSSVDEGGSLMKRLAKWVRGNIFTPDPRIFWVKPSTRYLKKIIKQVNIDVVISTGPPHSMHLIGCRLKKYFGNKINWIADFRDPWTMIDFYETLNVGKRADRKQHRLEKEVVRTCDKLVSVSKSWGNDFKEMGAENVRIITNGFDVSDYTFSKGIETNHFIITHIGSINSDRNPKVLWQAIQELTADNSDFKKDVRIQLIGNVHLSVISDVKKAGLTENVSYISYLPHKEALAALNNSSISLLLLNNTKNVEGIIPGKLFEYMGVGNPILTIGIPSGDTGKLVKENELGTISNFDDVKGAKESLLNFYKLYQSNNLKMFSKDKLKEFSIKHISELFQELF